METLLIVDDNKERLKQIHAAAVDIDFAPGDILSAANEDEAMHLIDDSNREIDLAIIDLVLTQLPEMTGLRVIESLRERRPNCRIIALTSQGDEAFGIDAMRAGADDFISILWEYINWYSLLKLRLKLWRGVVRSLATAKV